MGKTQDASEDVNHFEHEQETILRTNLEGNAARPPHGDDDSGEGHEPACRSTARRRDHAAVTQQLEQIVATSTNAGDPLRQ